MFSGFSQGWIRIVAKWRIMREEWGREGNARRKKESININDSTKEGLTEVWFS